MSVQQDVITTLEKHFGAQRAAALVTECCQEARIRRVATPGDLLRFAEVLIARGGLMAAVGRSLKVRALLAGADGVA